ncbi:hypothetical protein ASPWEDRAFT_39881 [Aspergillus wentii DTO 134E9]|uniref:ADP-ribose 1''-phosphate phosphatase n=1 Tax=Aspergillus wentii DTO 134E9 TaxID=1073089 RepID=A0A1L9RIP7_ASPWE|nr:uncharacterized protein ASPWEDRAFT_39881 [Aspergillus wentii DTO 134E9]OJJ34795.1 hypothetical protein ASPWEDRAFT_39881 [Aspergillus wentii DTO 134E9]
MQGKVLEIEGDLFDAPDGTALIHACNCQGSWGGGIAKAFKDQYPAAFEKYRAHCRSFPSKPNQKTIRSYIGKTGESESSSKTVRLPEGTALIIPPQESDYEGGSKKHWVVCLFTSRGYGRRVSPPETILENTKLAVADMKKQLAQLEAEEGGSSPSALWSCRFNSGLFAVDWELSREVLENAELEVTVVRPSE